MTVNNSRIYYYLFLTTLCIIILILLSVESILCLTPPIARDAIIHHLAIPKLWLKHGGFYEIKWSVFSYYPMNVDLLYIIPLYFNKDFIANFIHMSFGVATGLMIYYYLRNKISQVAGLLGMLVFLSTPMVILLSTQAYVDLGLTFFTTVSILTFIRYRDGEFREFKWLFLSATAMGLALGTKYNALIAWFFLSTAIVFVYSKDTKEQCKAVQCGFIFFLISFLIFSPWLIKNEILTGNPLYPLFNGIFNLNKITGQEGSYSVVNGDNYRGIFQFREMMYGENFRDTLLIPIRYFFQGQDNVQRYFDGVLNPVLIILPPFALMDKSFSRDKLFFASFAAFFIIMATFLDQTRIRYILPAIPVLCILTVIGFINIFNWGKTLSFPLRTILTTIIISVFIVLISRNFLYLKNHYQTISPMNYVLGKESRDEFITRHISSYPAIKYINTQTQQNAKIRIILLAGRGYYLDRDYEDDASMGMSFIGNLVAASGNDKTFQSHINSLEFTHLLMRTDLYLKYLYDNYSSETINRFLRKMNKATEIIYNENGYTVYRLISQR
jgi:hypothetical protein